MDLVDFIAVIRKWKWLVLCVMIVVIGLSVASGYVATSTYRADTTLVVGLSQIASSSSGGISLAQSGERIGLTYSELVTSEEVMKKALQKTGLEWSTNNLKGRVSVSTVKNTPVINISVSDTDPERAKIVANAVSEAFVEYIEDVGVENVERTETILTDELKDIENEITLQNSQPVIDTGKLIALQDRRDVILQGFEQLLQQKISSGDVRVSEFATFSASTGIKMTQRIAIGVILSLIAGIAMAFIAEAVSTSRKK